MHLNGENRCERREKTGMRSRYIHNVDGKNRLFMPSKYREELGSIFVVAQSFRDPCLTVRSLEEWEKYIAPIKQLARKDAERALRKLVGNSIEVTPDAQGRIIIPSEMLKFAGIEKETVIIGCSDYAEIWASEVRAQRELEEAEDDGWMQALEEQGL